MSHEIYIDSTGRASMAFIGDTPWHGLGKAMDENAPLEIWREQAGMNWQLIETPVRFNRPVSVSHPNGTRLEDDIIVFADKKVLYRSDTGTPLACVSAKYNVVQPEMVLEFYRDLIETAGFKMRTAGVLFGGKKYWALADIGEHAKVKGNEFGGYLLLATACDGSMATVAQFTSVEVVCNNTLRLAVHGVDGKTKPRLSIPHSAKFDADKVKAELGLSHSSWIHYIEEVRLLAERKVGKRETMQWLIDTFGDPELELEYQPAGPAGIMKSIYQLFDGQGKGAELDGRKGTLLGLVSATTEYYDFHTGHRTTDGRLEKAWFGETATMKQRAWDNAMLLAA